MQVAAIQMVSGTNVERNLDTAHGLVVKAAACGAELIALPEYFCALGMQDRDKLAYAEVAGDGVIQNALSDWAQTLGIWVVGGSLPLKTSDPERVTNTSLMWNPQGECVARYDKVHLFRYQNAHERYDESTRIAPGAEIIQKTITERSGSNYCVGLSICYDLRFPEMFRQQAAHGMDLLVIPSAFTYTTGQAHWELLLRARAIENQCYVLAPAQGGLHENGRRTWGHSLLADPWGKIVAQHENEGPGMVLGEVNLAYIRTVRQQLPALEHRVL